MFNPEINRRMTAIVAEARRRGIPMKVTSTYRSTAKQRALYAAYLQRGRTGLPAARPGLSTHEYGIAFDASFPAGREAEVAQIAAAHGMVWFGQGDRVHFDLFGPTRWNAILKESGLI